MRARSTPAWTVPGRPAAWAAALTAVALVAAACGGEESGAGTCQPGARACGVDAVLVCRADGAVFEILYACPDGYTCREAECVPRGWGGDVLVGDAAGRDAAGGSTDAPAPDAGPDAAGQPDVPPRPDAPAPRDVPPPRDTPPPPDVPPAGDVPGGDGASPPDAAADVRPPPPLCGNGVRDPGELCDPEAPAGTPGVCPTECPPPSGCVASRLEGEAARCTARCFTYTVTEVGPADGCCPGNADHDDDPDCPDTCGDGRLQDGERCDPGIATPAAGGCPRSCAPAVGCDAWVLEGSAADCSARCLLTSIATLGPADGCCPDPLGFGLDPDCEDPCGDGVLQSFEDCDRGIAAGAVGSCPSACPADEPCRGFTFEGSAAACTARCTPWSITAVGPADGCCPAAGTAESDPDCVPVCGNGRVEPGEDCDGGPPPGVTCTSLGFSQSGQPVCTEDCDLDTFPCGGHTLAYERIISVPPVSAARGSYLDVAWFPDGSTAFLSTERGVLLRYDAATASVAVLHENLVGSVGRLAALPWHDAVLVLGSDPGSGSARNGRAFLLTDPAGTPQPLPPLDLAGVALVAVALSPDGSEAVVGGYDDPGNVTHLYHVETDGWTVLSHRAFASYAGLSDVTWAHVPAGDPRFVLTFEGPTGAGSHSWYLDFGEGPQPNTWSAGFGNPGRGGWRPGGRYALAAAMTSEKLYVFSYRNAVSWGWTLASNIPGYTTDFRGVYWHPRGHRALVTGRATGIPRAGRLVEVIPRGADFQDSVDLRLADIVGFTEPPFDGGSSAHLHAAAWRPGPCEEGLIVGDDDGTSFSPTFGLLIRFVDVDDEDCE
jgi:hypothetical protein